MQLQRKHETDCLHAQKLSKRNVFYRSCLVESLNLLKQPAGRQALVEASGLGLIVTVVNVVAKVEAR